MDGGQSPAVEDEEGKQMKKIIGSVDKKRPVVWTLAALIFCTMLAGCAGGDVSALTDTVQIVSFSENNVSVITVEQGTEADAIGLPQTLEANIVIETEASDQPEMSETDIAPADGEQVQTVETTEQRDVPVSWQCADYNPDAAGAYVFTAQLQPSYVYEGDMPTVTVEVQATSEPAASDKPEPAESAEPEASAEPAAESGKIIINRFTNDSIAVEVPRGTAIEDIPLPKTLPAIDGNGDAVEVPVTWINIIDNTNQYEIDPNDYTAGSLHGYGPWVFTASIDPQYAYAGEPVTASVTIPDCNEIESFFGVATGEMLMRFIIFEGGSVNLPTEVSAIMTDGGYKNVPVSWEGSYDTQTAGTYELTMNIKDGYTGGGRATAEINVIQDYDKGQGEDQ